MGGLDDVATRPVDAPTFDQGLVVSEGSSEIGGMLGRYVVVDELGTGGMGRVVRAYDPHLQREVALKELRNDSLGSEGREQLVEEARAMAKLAHPNVVEVYDVEHVRVGDRLSVVLVMELVEGVTLRRWLRERPRSWREVVARFIAAGRGLEAAHRAGLIHRDFKPSNVLLGDEGVVKVSDFGLARMTGDPTSSTGASQPGSPEESSMTVAGTRRYMAPEQHARAEGGGASPTQAADQYAFCVSLWEAWCGEPPFSGKTLEDDKRRGPPAWPGTGVPTALVAAVRRGLAADPSERWPSMGELLEALQFDPVRRSRRVLAGGVVVACVVGAAFGGRAWIDAQARRCQGAQDKLSDVWDDAQRQRVEASMLATEAAFSRDAWTRADAELDAFAEQWVVMHTEACEAAASGEQSAELLDLRMACLRSAKDELAAAVRVLSQSDEGVVKKAGEVVGGLRPIDRCADLDALYSDVEPPDERDAGPVGQARTLLIDANTVRRAGRYDEALATIGQAVAGLEGVDYGPVRAQIAYTEGETLHDLGEYERAAERLRVSLRIAARWRQRTVMRGAASELLFMLGYRLRRPDLGMRYVPIARGVADGHIPTLGAVMTAQALVHQERGELEQSELLQREILHLYESEYGPDFPDRARLHSNLAVVLANRENFDESEEHHRRAIEGFEQSVGPNHPHTVSARMNFGSMLFTRGDHAEAEKVFREALVAYERIFGRVHPYVAQAQSNVASAIYLQGRNEEAAVETRKSLELLEKTLGPEHPYVSGTRNNLATILFELGRYEDSVREAEAAWVGRQRDGIAPAERGDNAMLLARGLWKLSRDPARRSRARHLAQRALQEYRAAGRTRSDSAREAQEWLEEHPLSETAAD